LLSCTARAGLLGNVCLCLILTISTHLSPLDDELWLCQFEKKGKTAIYSD